jgi:hypothetical protein
MRRYTYLNETIISVLILSFGLGILSVLYFQVQIEHQKTLSLMKLSAEMLEHYEQLKDEAQEFDSFIRTYDAKGNLNSETNDYTISVERRVETGSVLHREHFILLLTSADGTVVLNLEYVRGIRNE